MIRAGLIAAFVMAMWAPAQSQNLIHAFLAPPPPNVPYVAPASVGKPFPGARAARGNRVTRFVL